MDVVTVNWLAVLVAGVVKFLIGWAWYAPPVLGKKWMELSRITEADMRAGMAPAIIGQLVTDLIMAYVLARVVAHYGAGTIVDGALVALLVWVGFVATVTLASVLYEKRPVQLWLINNGYLVIGLVVMGAILAAWQGAPAPVTVPAV